MSQLTASNLLIGLVSPLGQAAWLFPQIFVSTRIQRMPLKMPSYKLAAVVRIFCWLALAAAVWLLKDPRLLLASFFLLYATARMVSGLGGLAFFDVIAKTIPAQRRGSFFAWRQLLGGLLGLGAGTVVTLILGHPALEFPHGHAVLFVLYCVVIIPSLAAFIAIQEPPGAVVKGAVTSGQQLHRAGQLLRKDEVFRRYMTIRLTMGLASIALPFYGIYAKTALGAPVEMVGVYVTARAAAQLLSNLPWGRLSDRRGNRIVLQIVILSRGLTASLALMLVLLVSLLQLEGAWLPFLALPIFVFDGAVQPAQMLVGTNFLLELAPEAERSLYLGLGSTLLGISIFLSGFGGLVVDLLGFVGLFTLALGLYLAAFAWSRRLPEPRTANV